MIESRVAGPGSVPAQGGSSAVRRGRGALTALALVGASLLGLHGPQAWAQANPQAFPNKPIRLILGPSSDLLPRLIAQKAQEIWTQPVIVDQRPGASGAIATEAVAKSPADGYTWLLGSASYVITEAMSNPPPFNLARDFEPVVAISTASFYLVTHPSVQAKSLAELVALAKAQPGKINFASSGNGTPAHLAGEMLKAMAGIDIVHVPYKSSAAAITDVIGGQVQMTFQMAPIVMQHVKSGKLNALAVSSPQRAKATPEYPTVIESGLPGFQMTGWTGIYVPTRTPRPVIDRINEVVRQVLQQPVVREQMALAGLEPPDANANSPEAFASFVKADTQRWNALVKQTGVKAD